MTRSRLNLAVAWAAATLCAHHAGAQSPASSPQPLPSRLPVAAPLAGPPTAPVAAPVAAPVSPEVPGAPEAASDLPAVRITGSALRRIDAETALPVTVLRRADIERSGARTTTELLQQLPQMQGYVRTTTVTGNDSFGYASASIHDLGDAYTLVLLNGLRVAPFAGQSASGALASVDLNTIPLAMVERIEVLNDGASALYGADALGGVVNIITRREGDANEATVGWTLPKGGAREWSKAART
jgi:iron complex outermembrane receptor protein